LGAINHQTETQRGCAQQFDKLAIAPPIGDLHQGRQKFFIARLTLRVALRALQIARCDGDRIIADGRLRSCAGAPQIDRHEGTILRFVFLHSIALACLVGILVMLQAYVFTGMIVQ
jgi:hypothetical protein